MGIILIILQLILALPKITSLVLEIIKIIKKIPDAERRRIALSELKDAIQKAKQTGDTSHLDAIYRKHMASGL